jgi:hypothetical protein
MGLDFRAMEITRMINTIDTLKKVVVLDINCKTGVDQGREWSCNQLSSAISKVEIIKFRIF